MSNSGLTNRRVRSLPKKMTLSAQPHFLTVQSPQERFKPLDQVKKGEILVETPVSYSLFPAFIALRSTYPANRPRMLSTSTLSWGLRDGPAFALRSVSRA